MTDAEKREKVIKGLECCMVDDGHSPKCELCPYTTVGDDTCQTMDELFTDALALLKAQEPRVIKVGDVRNWVNSDRVTREPVVIEIRGGVCAWIIDDEVRELPGEANLSGDLYGKTWRCWDKMPTDDQKEATPWE